MLGIDDDLADITDDFDDDIVDKDYVADNDIMNQDEEDDIINLEKDDLMNVSTDRRSRSSKAKIVIGGAPGFAPNAQAVELMKSSKSIMCAVKDCMQLVMKELFENHIFKGGRR